MMMKKKKFPLRSKAFDALVQLFIMFLNQSMIAK
jgi:hypothetical protein